MRELDIMVPGEINEAEEEETDQIALNFIDRFIQKICKVTQDGNPSRDHLANERTLLAYIRTSLNLVLYGLVLLQLAKYIVIAPVNGLSEEINQRFVDKQQENILADTVAILDVVNKYSRVIGVIVFSSAIVVLIFGIFRYLRIQQLLFSDADEFESGLLFANIVCILSILVSVLAFVYTYNL